MSLAVNSPAFIRRGETHRFPIFSDRSPRDRDALAREDLDMMTGDAQLHDLISLYVTVLCHLPLTRLRSFDGARPIVSRYLATVRPATGMPSPERISAIRLSL